jgi:hypothetical protein
MRIAPERQGETARTDEPMWNTSLVNNGCLDSVANLLVSTLRSVLIEAEYLRRARCEPPVIEPGSESDEIYARLAEFRIRVKEIERREAMLIAGVYQARTWAQDLRKMAPGLRPEIDVFRLATSQCSTLQESWLPNPVDLFDGGKHPQKFIDRRYNKSQSDGSRHGGGSYEVCGQVAVSEIVFACEALLARLSPEYDETREDEHTWDPDWDEESISATATPPAIPAPGVGEPALTQDRSVLDLVQTAEDFQALMGLELRAEETMRPAHAVQAGGTPTEASEPGATETSPQLESGVSASPTFDFDDEILLPLDAADDFFAGVPGVDLGHA